MHFGYEQRCWRKGPNWTKQSFRRWIHILFRLRRNKEFRFREWVNEKFRLYICTSSSPCGYKLKKNRFFPSTNCKRIVVFWPITPLDFKRVFFIWFNFQKIKLLLILCFFIPQNISIRKIMITIHKLVLRWTFWLLPLFLTGAVELCIESLGRIDVFVNNAGIVNEYNPSLTVSVNLVSI